VRYLVLVLSLLSLLAGMGITGCGSAVPRTEPAVPTVTAVPPTPEPTTDVIPQDAGDVLSLARDDMARRLDVNQEKIDVVSVEAVQWANTCLGCPEPGEVCGESVSSGFRIILRAAGERYTYHTLRDGMAILCEGGRPVGTPVRSARDLEGPYRMVRLAREDLAQRLSVDTAQIDVVDARARVWRDASLGCLKPGMTYAEVRTPGVRVILQVRGERYVYHTDREETVVLCEERSMMATPTAPSPVESVRDNLIQSVKEDLAERLSVQLEQIDLVDAASVVWPDGSLGCPEPGMMYTQALVPGYRIVLEVGGRQFRYHASDRGHFVLCTGTAPAGDVQSEGESK
jgi:hypothetical protein